MKLFKELAVKSSEAHEYYFKALENYESAVFNNEPETGFRVLVETLEYYNSNKQRN